MTYTGDIKNTWTQFEITLPVHVIAVTCFAGPEGLPLKQKGYPILSELALLNKPTLPLEPQPTEVCVPSDHTYFPVHHVFFLSLLVEEFRHGLCACGLQHESQCLGEGGREGWVPPPIHMQASPLRAVELYCNHFLSSCNHFDPEVLNRTKSGVV